MNSPDESDSQALQFLARNGYLPLSLSDQEGLVEAYTTLFTNSSHYFHLPESSPHKTSVAAKTGPAASEEGYFQIPSEKSILTIRTSTACPEPLQSQLQDTWNLTGTFLADVIISIARTLQLPPDVFAPLVDPCSTLPPTHRTPTLLRLFRYDRPTGPEPVVTAERHKDLGLLSLVVGRSPGLQVLDPATGNWVPIEDDAVLPAGARAQSGGLTATLLVGETLAFLSRGRFRAGVHRVMCAPRTMMVAEREEEPYRFSIVFALRPAVAPVFTREFESAVVGRFEGEERAEGESSTVLFERIRRNHWNVNASPEVRERQREERRRRVGVEAMGS